MAYQGYSSDDDGKKMTASAQPVEMELDSVGDKGASLTLVEIVLNREPSPLDKVSEIFKFL